MKFAPNIKLSEDERKGFSDYSNKIIDLQNELKDLDNNKPFGISNASFDWIIKHRELEVKLRDALLDK